MHGALWLQMKTAGAVNERAGRLAKRAWWGVVSLTAIVTLATFAVQPQVRMNLSAWPWGFVFPVLAIGGLAGVRLHLARRNEAETFLSSCACLAGGVTSLVFCVYPI